MLTEKEILEVFEFTGAVIHNSHLVYTSGRHGSSYVNKDALYPHPELTSLICKDIAERYQSKDIDAVIAPAVGGIILSQWISYHLSILKGEEVLGVYAEKDNDGGFVIKRGYDDLIRGKKVLIVEDILTTGGSVKKVVEAVRKIPSTVVAVAALCNRGGLTAAQLGDVPELTSLMKVTLESWDEKACPLCAKKIPINTQVGKGQEFLTK